MAQELQSTLQKASAITRAAGSDENSTIVHVTDSELIKAIPTVTCASTAQSMLDLIQYGKKKSHT